MVTFTKSQVEYLATQVSDLREMEDDKDSPIYCLLTHAMEDLFLITELHEL